MYALLARIASFLPAAAPAEGEDVAQRLMESAEARAGTSQHEAQELRDAAFAYLSVVR